MSETSYRIRLSPIGSWHFSNPRISNLGNQNDYFHPSRIFPTQTALFGTLRRALGIAAGVLEPGDTSFRSSEAVTNMIGPINWASHTDSFGIIACISPVLLGIEAKDYVYRRFEALPVEEDQAPTKFTFPAFKESPQAKVAYPLLQKRPEQDVRVLTGVDAKTYFKEVFVPITADGALEEGASLAVDKLVAAGQNKQVNTISRAQSDLEGFYITERRRFKKPDACFVTYLTTKEALSDEVLYALNQLRVPLQGGDNQFQLHITEMDRPTWLSPDLPMQDGAARMLALSPVKVFKDYMQQVDRAHSALYTHRSLLRKASSSLYGKPEMSDIEFWADKGSVFWTSKALQRQDWPIVPKALERQGFGYFLPITTKK